jgi:hypothetical protein
MTPAPIMPILFGGLIAWGIYRRLRRNIGRQKLRPVRLTISIVIFSVASVVLLVMSLGILKLMLGIGGGLALGVPLGFVGLRLTRFETTAEGHFYTPNTKIGIALSLLFLGRLAYRFWALRHATGTLHTPPPFQSALTYFLFGLIAGYYIAYYIGLFVHTHDKK